VLDVVGGYLLIGAFQLLLAGGIRLRVVNVDDSIEFG
jgi:hypothetical protein